MTTHTIAVTRNRDSISLHDLVQASFEEIIDCVPSISEWRRSANTGRFSFSIKTARGFFGLHLSLVDAVEGSMDVLVDAEIHPTGWRTACAPPVLVRWPARHALSVQREHVDRLVCEFLAGVPA